MGSCGLLAPRLSLLLAAALVLLVAGCSKRVKADFPRPPATASMPPAENGGEMVSEVPSGAEEPIDEPEPEPEVVEPVSEPEPPPPPTMQPVVPEEEPEPPAASAALAGDDGADPQVLSKLEEAGTLLASVAGRELSEDQRAQVTAARGFVAQARRALDVGDDRRALVLVDKGLLLAEDVERTSRR